MRPQRWLAWFANLLLVVTIVATGAHSHHGRAVDDRGCAVCTVAHAPVAPASIAAAPRAPEPTREVAIEIPVLEVTPAPFAVPLSRGPPLA